MHTTTGKYAGMLLGLVSAGVLQAQESSSAIEEIVVTASKRGSQLIQDIPITVQAISGQRLEEIGALDFNDYFRLVPGLSVNDQGPGHKTYIIRGISSSGAGTVGLYFDETIVTGEFLSSEGGRQPDLRLFDMNRVEVAALAPLVVLAVGFGLFPGLLLELFDAPVTEFVGRMAPLRLAAGLP